MVQINPRNIFLTLLGFQITWLFCVFGEYYKISFLGLMVGILYLLIFFYFNSNRIQSLKICLIFSSIGYLFDSIMGYSELFIFKSNNIIGYLPIWFLVLWPSFTTLFVNVLLFIKNYPIVAFIMGALLAPPTYYLGIPLGIAQSNNILFAMIVMVIFWGCFLTLYSFYIKKNNSF